MTTTQEEQAEVKPSFFSRWEGVIKSTRKLRPDLTESEAAKARKIGSVEFKSAGAKRKR